MEGTVSLDGVELPIADDSAMNDFRFRKVSIVPQYAMSALNPIRKIGRMISELLDSRGVSYDETRPELSRRLALVGLDDGSARPLSDRALRRPEATRRHGAVDAAEPVAPDRGRAHVGARRLDAEGGRRDARRVPRPRVREEHDRDHARPLDPLPDRRHDPGHVRGQARREGPGGRAHRRPAASVHEAPHRLAPRGGRAVSPRSGSRASRDDRRRSSTRRRAAGSAIAARSHSRSAWRSHRSSRSRPGRFAACWKAAA